MGLCPRTFDPCPPNLWVEYDIQYSDPVKILFRYAFHRMIPLTARTPSVIEIVPTVALPAALPDRIYATLKHRILTCSMTPGERIVEKELCAEMHVSRTPMREAFNRLSLEGLIVVQPYRGFVVAPVTVESYQELCELRR